MEEAPFRNSSLGPAAPRTILEYNWQKGGPLYQPFKETAKNTPGICQSQAATDFEYYLICIMVMADIGIENNFDKFIMTKINV